jgi:CHAT domain-containing protein
MTDLRTALRLGRTSRCPALSANSSTGGADVPLDQMRSALIEAGNRLFLQTGDSALIRETFVAAEENRARSSSPPNAADPAFILGSARSRLVRSTALFSFQLGDSISWLWALDREGMTVYALPARGQIESRIQAATRKIRENSPDAVQAGAELYATLFGPVSTRFHRRTRWLLALDPALYGVPVAALPEKIRPFPVYVAMKHTVEVIPGAAHWMDDVSTDDSLPGVKLLLGVGDPIYNAADPRAHGRGDLVSERAPALSRFFSIPSVNEAPALNLPRLVGSGEELDACARAWDGESILLKGSGASRASLLNQLLRNPAVVHFATHFLESPGDFAEREIALSLTDQGEVERLTPTEVAGWKLHTDLVILNGCDSGVTESPSGGGLVEMTNAWLSAGARSVIGARWAIADEDGALFAALYRNLRKEKRNPALALRAAQLEMLHAADWRANPRYWGAYSVFEN